jgi:hypothetical protein
LSVIGDQSRPEEWPFRVSVSEEEILSDFKKLIKEGKLHGAARDPAIVDGAEFDSKVMKKKGKGTRFLIRKIPSQAKLLRLWARLFENAISPRALIEALSAETLEFEQRETLLLFGRDWIMYDAQIFHGEEGVGELTLSFESLPDPTRGVLGYFSGPGLKVVRIEHIRLTAQKSGYASTLFRHYERLFRDLGFRQFQLNASLSIGKYYWAKEGFDFSDESEIARRKEQLRALVKERNLPVTEAEIGQLDHAYDFARFKPELRIAVYRDGEGYYSLRGDDRFREEIFLPLGKAFLLSQEPWEGYKTISTAEPIVRATSAHSSG